MEKTATKRKTKYKFNLRFYAIITALIVIVAGIILSKTVFFNITDITIENTTPYSNDEILSALKISVGNNLFSINMSKRAENLENNLAYVGTATLKRKLPSTLEISVLAPTPKMNIQTTDGLFYIVSDTGKVLEMNMPLPCQGYTTVYGYEPTNVSICDIIDSVNIEKKNLVDTIFASLEKNGFSDVVNVDVSNITEISVQFNQYQKISIGTSEDIEFKLELARAIINKRGNVNEMGTINVKNTQHPAFIGSHVGATNKEPTQENENEQQQSQVDEDEQDYNDEEDENYYNDEENDDENYYNDEENVDENYYNDEENE